MKLLSIANRYYMIILPIVFLAGSLAAFFILKSIINKEFNEKLHAEQQQLIYELRTYENLQKSYYLNIGDVIELQQVDEDPKIPLTLKDTVMYDPYEKKELPFRLLTFSDEIKGDFYIITISKSLLPNQDLIEGISEIMLGIVLLIMASLALLNRVIFRKLWLPFHQIVTQLRLFQITRPVPLNIEPSNVEEFNQLTTVLDTMISKSIKDYKNLKEYTENTSHEIQTPLAIIKNKAEMLLQEPLPENILKEISKIYEAAGRLSRLKEGLSLLTKIDNNQFVESEPIDLRQYVANKLADLEELIVIKNLKTETHFEADVILLLNSDLAHMMITNLLNNAIKHNVEKGKILVRLTAIELTIQNTGNDPKIPTDLLFDRFRRSGNTRESTGLGLSLIRKIADNYGMKVHYSYSNGWHTLTVRFPETKK